MNTPTDLLVLEAEEGYEIFDHEELFEGTPGHKKASSEEILVISGTITVSF